MGRKVGECVERKRELLYSFSTVVFTPILYYFAVTSAFPSTGGHGGEAKEKETVEGVTEGPLNVSGDLQQYILNRRELPLETVLSVVAVELVKLLIVFTLYPSTHLFDQTPSLSSMWKGSQGNGGGGCVPAARNGGRLPFSKRDRENVFVRSPPLQIKVLEILKGVCNFVGGCVICHVFVVLLGAPILHDLKVTFQFSVILTTWLFGPLCLAVHPGRLLQDLLFISSWTSETEILYRAKWRFALTTFGAWAGAVVIPLDWDRPWQSWPIPCLLSTTFTFHIINLILALHLLCTIFEFYHRIFSSESSKIKNF